METSTFIFEFAYKWAVMAATGKCPLCQKLIAKGETVGGFYCVGLNKPPIMTHCAGCTQSYLDKTRSEI